MASRYHGAVVDVTGTDVRQFGTDCAAEMAGWLTAQSAGVGRLAVFAWDMENDGATVDVDTLRERAANAERPEGCRCPTLDGGGDCEWCAIYYGFAEVSS